MEGRKATQDGMKEVGDGGSWWGLTIPECGECVMEIEDFG